MFRTVTYAIKMYRLSQLLACFFNNEFILQTLRCAALPDETS
jgi:hypothetical protein